VTASFRNVCRELLGRATANDPHHRAKLEQALVPQRFRELHPDAVRLIDDWRRRAGESADDFEAFVFGWISFNAWAECVTGRGRDEDWRDALALNATMCKMFDRRVRDSTDLRSQVSAFSASWPIFRVQQLRQLGVAYIDTAAQRNELVVQYLDAGATAYAPRCWLRHTETPEPVPTDWPHVLAGLYRVRSNLFHGEKARHSEIDRGIMASASAILTDVVGQCLALG
jgi:hypothetical protein